MFLSMHGQPSDVDSFEFFLAEKLGKTLTEVREMPNTEYVGWCAYFEVRAEMERARG
jgi:hypothetical protein